MKLENQELSVQCTIYSQHSLDYSVDVSVEW